MLENQALNNPNIFPAVTFYGLAEYFHFRQKFAAPFLDVNPSGPQGCGRKERKVRLRVSRA